MTFLEKLNWRYATKAMNGQKVPEEKINLILEAIRLTPTSSGLQPFEVYVITKQETKDAIMKASYNQQQVGACSHLFVFVAFDNYTEERINKMFDLTNQERGFINEGWENYRQMLLGLYPGRDAETNFQHTSRQAYIALGFGLLAAAELEVDATPMEGFEDAKVDEILGLREKRLRSVLLMPVGYRDADKDWLANLKKVRRPSEDFIHKDY